MVVVALEISAAAETLSGTIRDPQQRLIVGASVSLRCAKHTETKLSDNRGQFAFQRRTFARSCVILAAYPGFATYRLKLGTARNLAVQLTLAVWKQTATVRADPPPFTPLGSVSLSHSDLSAISDDPRDLLAYAKALAGINSGADHIYVNGLPTSILPSAHAIERITINDDPFSAEYNEGSDNHIEILTREVDRNFRVRFGGASLALGGHNALNSHLGSSQRGGKLEMTGPVPDLPVSFAADADGLDRHTSVPIEATVPPALVPSASGTSATAVDANLAANLAAYYVPARTLHMTGNFYEAMASQSNMNVQGWTLPPAGSGETSGIHEFRVSTTQTGRNHVNRGGFALNSTATRVTANSTALGISVLGAFVAGGAYFSRQDIQNSGWLAKDVLESSWHGHLWRVGATVSEGAASQLEVPNPSGMVQFPTLSDYLASLKGSAATGTWLVARGNGRAAYSSYGISQFAEGEIVRRAQVLIRAGLRSDYQSAGGVLLGPRLSAVTTLRSFVVRLGTGRFVQNWSNGMFLTTLADDGAHLQQFLANDVSFQSLFSNPLLRSSSIVARVAPGLARPRSWISKVSAARPLPHGLVPAIEYTYTLGSHLLGSRRLPWATGWSDVLESNRASQAHEIRMRATCKVKGQALTANYDWIHAFDNTDGPFSFPANQNNLRAEWARSTGTSPHNVSLVAGLRPGKRIALSLVEVWRSGAPLNLTTGVEQPNGLFTARGGRPRNSGTNPAYHSLDLYATRKIRLPFFTGSQHKACLDLGLQAQNLLGKQNYTSVGSIIGTPLFGRPLTAMPGRSLRFSVNFER